MYVDGALWQQQFSRWPTLPCHPYAYVAIVPTSITSATSSLLLPLLLLLPLRQFQILSCRAVARDDASLVRFQSGWLFALHGVSVSACGSWNVRISVQIILECEGIMNPCSEVFPKCLVHGAWNVRISKLLLWKNPELGIFSLVSSVNNSTIAIIYCCPLRLSLSLSHYYHCKTVTILFNTAAITCEC